MYAAGLLESVFVEKLNEKDKNEIIGCIYRHPTMDVKSFNENYLNDVLAKISDEKKICYLSSSVHGFSASYVALRSKAEIEIAIGLLRRYSPVSTSLYF